MHMQIYLFTTTLQGSSDNFTLPRVPKTPWIFEKIYFPKNKLYKILSFFVCFENARKLCRAVGYIYYVTVPRDVKYLK